MNESLLIGQLVLLVALVPCVYTANFYYKAYQAEREKHKRVNGTLVLDKYFLVTELMERVEDWKFDGDDVSPGSYAVGVCSAELQFVLDGNKRRLAEAKRRVNNV